MHDTIVMQLVSRANWILHENGFLALLRSLILYLTHYFFLLLRFDIYESTLDPPPIKCDVDDLTIRIITHPEELTPLESKYLVAEGFKISRNGKMLSMDAIMFCAFVGDELVHVTYAFVDKKAHERYPLSFAMQYGHTVGLSGRTAMKYRRKGIYAYTRVKALEYLRMHGFCKAWDVQNGDVAARNAVLKVGYYFWGNGYRLRLLSIFIIEWTNPKSALSSRSIKCSWSI